MALETDLFLERRRLKRRLGGWRALALLLLVLGGAALLAPALDLPGEKHVARLPLRGFIGEDQRLLRLLEEMVEDTTVRAVIVAIDSPGGSVAGGEAMHAAIARLRQAGKPVVAVMGGTAASAGYMVALPAERIFAREATLTGSIGVLLQSFEASELMGRLGVRSEALTSGPLKDQPSPFRPLTEEGRAALAAVVADMHAQFVAKVVAGRGMAEARVRALADGRVMSGRQALEAGLVDAIGGEREAREWLRATHGVPSDLPVEELDPRGRAERLLGAAVGALWRAGIEALGPLLVPR